MAKKKELSKKQQAFVSEYLIDMNATQAAIRAGYSAKTVAHNVTRMMENEEVKAAIEAGLAKKADRNNLSADLVIKRLLNESEPGATGANCTSRVKALELLGKHLTMWVDRKEVSGPGGAPLQQVDPAIIDAANDVRAFMVECQEQLREDRKARHQKGADDD